ATGLLAGTTTKVSDGLDQRHHLGHRLCGHRVDDPLWNAHLRALPPLSRGRQGLVVAGVFSSLARAAAVPRHRPADLSTLADRAIPPAAELVPPVARAAGLVDEEVSGYVARRNVARG